jgi:hypothetical protein
LFEELNRRLVLRKQSVADPDVAFRRPTDNYGLTFVLVVINLTSGGPSEDLKLEFELAVIIVDVDTRLEVDALLLLILGGLHVLLNIRIHAE